MRTCTAAFFLFFNCLVVSIAAQTAPPSSTRASNHVRYLRLDISTYPHQYIFDGWMNKTGGTIEVVTRTVPTLPAEINRDLAVEGYFDVYQIFQPIFDYAVRRQVADLTDSVYKERFGFQWLDVMLSARKWLTEVQGRVYSVPVDADPLVLYYRRDLISEPPTTWEELIATARRFHGRDLNGDGVPDFGTCLITQGQFGMYAFAIGNTIARYSGDRREHYLFDANTDDALPMKSLINTKVYEYAFDILKDLYNVSQGAPLTTGAGADQSFGIWKTGRCATFVSFPSVGVYVGEAPSTPGYIGGTPCCTFIHGKQGTVRTPGSTKVFVRETNELRSCDAGLCPSQEFGGVNRPTFMNGAVQLVINAKTPVLEAATSFAAHFSANADVRVPGALNPYRSKHFNASWFEALTPVSWPAEDARLYTSALFDTMNSPTTASQLRMPGNSLIAARFETAMKEHIGFGGVQTNRTISEILTQLESDIFSGLFADGLTRDAVEDFFRTDVGLPPRQYPSDAADSGAKFPAWALAPIIAVILLIIVAVFLRHYMQTAAAPKNADEPVAIALIAIKGLGDLASEDPELAAQLLAKTTALVRDAASATGAYYVKRIGDALMVSAGTTDRAVSFGVRVLEHVNGLGLDAIQRTIDERTGLSDTRSFSTGHRGSRADSRSQSSRASSKRSHKKSREGSERASVATRARRLNLQVSIGVHFALCQITHDSDRNAYDYSGTAVDGAAVCADVAAHGELVISENVRDNVDSMPDTSRLVARGNYPLRGSGEQTLSALYTEKMPMPSLAVAEDGGHGNMLAAIDQASGRLGKKRVAVAHVRLGNLERLQAREDPVTFHALAEDLHRLVVDVAMAQKGVVHSATSGVYVVTFNAATDCMLPFQQALRFANVLRAELPPSVTPSIGVSVGTAYCGKFVPMDTPPAQAQLQAQQVVFGPALDQAAILAAVARRFPSFLCVTTASVRSDAESLAVTAMVDIVRLPHTPVPVGALGVVTLRGDGASEEWMYVLHGAANAFATTDQGFSAVLERDLDAAKDALKAQGEANVAIAQSADSPVTRVTSGKLEDEDDHSAVIQRITDHLAARIAQLAGADPAPSADAGPIAAATFGLDGTGTMTKRTSVA